LHIACQHGHESSVRYLLSFGTSINLMPLLSMQNNDGETPLHSAVRGRSVRCVKDLLLKGASRKDKNSEDQTPFDVAK